jgi:hypothetical protein
VVPDLLYHELLKTYLPREGFQPVPAQCVETPWQQTNTASEASRLELSLPESPGAEGYSLLLSVAIQYGKLGVTGAIEPLPKAVASKVLAAV